MTRAHSNYWLPCVFMTILLPALAQESRPSDDEDFLALARSIAKGMAASDSAALIDAFDWQAFGKTVTAGVEVRADFKTGFEKGLRKSLPHGLCDQITAATKAGGSYTFLRIRREDTRQTLLFRLLTAAGAMNYHEFRLARDAAGKPRITDVYIYLSGELLSETLRATFVRAAAEFDRTLLERLFGKDRDFLDSATKLRDLSKAVRAEEYEEARRIFGTLPEAVRTTKCCLLLRLAVDMNTDEKQYLATIAEIERRFPGDPALDLVSIDRLYAKKDYEALERTLDRLDRRLGGDAWLDCVRGGAWLEAGETARGRKLLERAVEREPSLTDPYFRLIQICLEAKDWRRVADLLTRLERETDIRFDHVADVDIYSEFVKTPEYKEWLRKRPAK